MKSILLMIYNYFIFISSVVSCAITITIREQINNDRLWYLIIFLLGYLGYLSIKKFFEEIL